MKEKFKEEILNNMNNRKYYDIERLDTHMIDDNLCFTIVNFKFISKGIERQVFKYKMESYLDKNNNICILP
jgi:hypothetical protein